MNIKNLAGMLLALASMLIVACAPKQSAENVAKKTATPFELMLGMKVNSLEVCDECFVAKCVVSDEYMALVFEDGEFMKVNVNSYSVKEPKLEAVRQVMKQDGMSIRLEVVSVEGDSVNCVTMSVEEFCDPMPRARVVRAAAAAENAVCPMDMGGGASIVSAKAQGDDTVVYTVECDDSYRSFDFPSIEEQMKGEIINSIADASTKQERKDMGIYYKYVYMVGSDVLHTITITPNDWMLY